MDNTYKGNALLEWVKGWNDTAKLNAIVTNKKGDVSLVLEPSPEPLAAFIDGSKRKAIQFSLVGMFDYSSYNDTVNEEANALMESWHTWVSEQFALGNLPDFGDATIENIEPIETVPTPDMVYDQVMAKYSFSAVITYCEK